MKDLKPYVLPLSLAAVQWIATTLLRVDRVFFTYDHVTPWMIATKVLYFLFLAVAWCFLFAAVRNIRDNKAGWRRGAQVFAVYWPITLIFQILLWLVLGRHLHARAHLDVRELGPLAAHPDRRL